MKLKISFERRILRKGPDQKWTQIKPTLFIYLFFFILMNTSKLHFRSDGLKHVQGYDRHKKAYTKMKHLI